MRRLGHAIIELNKIYFNLIFYIIELYFNLIFYLIWFIYKFVAANQQGEGNVEEGSTKVEEVHMGEGSRTLST